MLLGFQVQTQAYGLGRKHGDKMEESKVEKDWIRPKLRQPSWETVNR